jgi:hypothetical protein
MRLAVCADALQAANSCHLCGRGSKNRAAVAGLREAKAMSMICWLLGLTPAQIGALRATPALASSLVTATLTDRASRFDAASLRVPPEQRAAFEARRAELEAQAKAAIEAGPRGKEIADARERIAALGTLEQALDLEKSWHILHYVCTGRVHPTGAPGDLLLTGEELGDDIGYGPARLHEPAATRGFSQFLEIQDVARLQSRVDVRAMNAAGVYAIPEGLGATAHYEEELRQEVGYYFPRLRDYVRRMADKGNGLLIWVS